MTIQHSEKETPHTVSGTLKKGLLINGVRKKKFVIREMDVLDMLEAEKEVSVQQVHAFNVQQLCRALVSVDDFKGPFVPAMFHRLNKADYYKLLNAMSEADDMGEGEQESADVS